MAEYKYNMDLKRIKQIYRNKFIILCQSGDTQTPDVYQKYQIIDILNQPLEKNLIFLLKDKNKIRKVFLNQEVLQTGKGVTKVGDQFVKIRIVNARNFPIADSSYFSI